MSDPMRVFRTEEEARKAGWAPVWIEPEDPNAAFRVVENRHENARILTPSEARALEVLESIEWLEGDGYTFCPECCREQEEGHIPSCKLASVLKELRGEG